VRLGRGNQRVQGYPRRRYFSAETVIPDPPLPEWYDITDFYQLAGVAGLANNRLSRRNERSDDGRAQRD